MPHSGEVFGAACCEGLASDKSADAACVELCQRKVCEKARANHLALRTSFCAGGCGFSMSACMTGEWHEQTLDYFLAADQKYWLQARCIGAENNESMTDDVFDWRERPNDLPLNNPRMCKGTEDSEKDTSVVILDDLATEDAGTVAAVTWATASSSGREDSQDLAVRFGYDVIDCEDQERCLDLGVLEVSLPATTVQGIALENVNLSVYQVDAQPVLSSAGAFSFAPGTVHAILSAVAGGVPLVLTGTNRGRAQGQISPAAGVVTLSGLSFGYSDSEIAADLRLDLVGRHVHRGPTSVIAPVDVPSSCDDPVTFRAASFDPDGQTPAHVWWIPGRLVSAGPTLEVVLADGEHTVGLLSRDPDGHIDAVAVPYTRSCR